MLIERGVGPNTARTAPSDMAKSKDEGWVASCWQGDWIGNCCYSLIVVPLHDQCWHWAVVFKSKWILKHLNYCLALSFIWWRGENMQTRGRAKKWCRGGKNGALNSESELVKWLVLRYWLHAFVFYVALLWLECFFVLYGDNVMHIDEYLKKARAQHCLHHVLFGISSATIVTRCLHDDVFLFQFYRFPPSKSRHQSWIDRVQQCKQQANQQLFSIVLFEMHLIWLDGYREVLCNSPPWFSSKTASAICMRLSSIHIHMPSWEKSAICHAHLWFEQHPNKVLCHWNYIFCLDSGSPLEKLNGPHTDGNTSIRANGTEFRNSFQLLSAFQSFVTDRFVTATA